MIMSQDICWMFCIGFLSRSAFIMESSLWSGGAKLAVHPPT